MYVTKVVVSAVFQRGARSSARAEAAKARIEKESFMILALDEK